MSLKIAKNRALWIIIMLFFLPAFRFEQPLVDKNLEQKAKELFLEIRCASCDGETLSESNSDFAFDSRQLIRNKLKSGEKPVDILNFYKQRYGQEILQNPDSNAVSNLFLWLFPAVLLILLARYFYRSKEGQ